MTVTPLTLTSRQDWLEHARCTQLDPDLWTEDSPGYRERAVHECNHHCPVKEQCNADALAHPAFVPGTIRAGVLWSLGHKRGARIVPAMAQPRQGTCPDCKPRLQRRLQRERAAQEYTRP